MSRRRKIALAGAALGGAAAATFAVGIGIIELIAYSDRRNRESGRRRRPGAPPAHPRAR